MAIMIPTFRGSGATATLLGSPAMFWWRPVGTVQVVPVTGALIIEAENLLELMYGGSTMTHATPYIRVLALPPCLGLIGGLMGSAIKVKEALPMSVVIASFTTVINFLVYLVWTTRLIGPFLPVRDLAKILLGAGVMASVLAVTNVIVAGPAHLILAVPLGMACYLVMLNLTHLLTSEERSILLDTRLAALRPIVRWR